MPLCYKPYHPLTPFDVSTSLTDTSPVGLENSAIPRSFLFAILITNSQFNSNLKNLVDSVAEHSIYCAPIDCATAFAYYKQHREKWDGASWKVIGACP